MRKILYVGLSILLSSCMAINPNDSANHQNNDDNNQQNAAATGPRTIDFHIADGTGSGSWNTIATSIVAQQGDTIRVYNDDASGEATAQKEIHSSGTPGPHGSGPIPVGGHYDWPITAVSYDPSMGPAVYNHFVGPSARFYVTVNAASFQAIQTQIFNASCISCHSGSNPSGGVNLTSYSNVMAAGVIVTGQPNNSALYTAVQSQMMPQSGTPVAADLQYQLYLWIKQGAMNN